MIITIFNVLLDRMNRLWADPESGNLEDVATVFLVGLLSIVTLIAIL